jgi:hypothetical protein
MTGQCPIVIAATVTSITQQKRRRASVFLVIGAAGFEIVCSLGGHPAVDRAATTQTIRPRPV